MTSSAVVRNALSIEGMTSEDALALMDIFVKRAVRATGDSRFAEFGAYKGRTACLLAQNIGPSGGLEVVDPADYLLLDELLPYNPKIRWHKQKSEEFSAQALPTLLANQRLTATHHDASHFFTNVRSELAAIQPLMHDQGVVILDDFNDVYAQVRAAYYHLRYTTNFPFEILAIGFNKCILVHEDHFAEQEAFVLDELIAEMDSEYGYLCRLARTDNHPLSRGFCVTRRASPESERRYGTGFFGDRFYRRSN